MKLFVDTGSIKDIEAIAASAFSTASPPTRRCSRRRPATSEPNLKQICEIVKGPVSGEVTATDFAGMMREGHDIAKIDQHMVVKVPLTQRRHQGVQGAVGRGHPGQRHAVLLGGAGAARREGRRDVRQPVRRPARRHRDERHGADSRDRGDLRQLRTSRPKCSSPAAATRSTSSRRRSMGADICTCPPAVIEAAVQPSADQHRPREVPEGLGKGAGGRRR